jgi:hypothetical protein
MISKVNAWILGMREQINCEWHQLVNESFECLNFIGKKEN